jgi:hypothetical protein
MDMIEITKPILMASFPEFTNIESLHLIVFMGLAICCLGQYNACTMQHLMNWIL